MLFRPQGRCRPDIRKVETESTPLGYHQKEEERDGDRARNEGSTPPCRNAAARTASERIEER